MAWTPLGAWTFSRRCCCACTVPIFWMAGTHKLADMESTIAWFGNPGWGLGLPFPALLAWLAALTEAGGAVLLLLGLAVRWISIPLMVTMLVAIFAVHWEFGWQAIADPSAPFANERVLAAAEKLSGPAPSSVSTAIMPG